MRDEAVLLRTHVPASRTLSIAPVGYEQFRQQAWMASQELTRKASLRRGVISIPELRQLLRQVPTKTFNDHLLRLERNGLVYLIPPEDTERLTEEQRRACLPHLAGDLRAFILWMSPKARSASFWD